jgi:HAD superfamily hydrolase (TIGR01490 family)
VSHQRGIAVFDMDRTLVREDTAGLFIRYEYEQGRATRVAVARVMWWRFMYKFGMMNVDAVARKALRWYRGRDEAALRRDIAVWYPDWVCPQISDSAREAVKRHQDAGDLVVIATGSPRYSTEPVAAELGIEHLITTELEVVDGVLTGRVHMPLCYGAGKLQRVSQFLAERGAEAADIVFYSDSITDLPLLTAARTPVVVNPDPKLRLHAERLGWRIESW